MLTGCICCLPVTSFLVELLHWSELELRQGCVVGLPNKEPVESLVCRRISGFVHALDAAVVVDQVRMRKRLKLAGRVRAYQQQSERRRRWRLQQWSMAGRRCPAVAFSGRRAAVFFPPGHDAKWEAVLCPVGRHGILPWHPRHPKWRSPRRRRGEADAEAVDSIAFQIFSSGSFLQSSGTCLYFLVPLSPFVQSVVLFCYE